MKRIYDFKCNDCGELFEKMTATPEHVECKKCGSLNTEKVFSTPAFKIDAYDRHMKVAR